MAFCRRRWINNVAGLTVAQQAVRVREIRPEGDVPGLVVEIGLDRTDLAGLSKLVAVRQHELDFRIILILSLLQVGLVIEVAASGTLK